MPDATGRGIIQFGILHLADIVYNNLPWPQAISAKQKQNIEEMAQAVLDARAKHASSSGKSLVAEIGILRATDRKANPCETARLSALGKNAQ
jgi:hypothetical protein